jgi:putative flippase GtrA
MFAWFASLLSGIFSFKFFMSGVFMTIIGVVAYNLIVDTVEEVFNYAIATASGIPSSSFTSQSFTGFAGWFLSQMYIPQTFAVIVTCVIIRFTLRKIPFLNW